MSSCKYTICGKLRFLHDLQDPLSINGLCKVWNLLNVNYCPYFILQTSHMHPQIHNSCPFISRCSYLYKVYWQYFFVFSNSSAVPFVRSHWACVKIAFNLRLFFFCLPLFCFEAKQRLWKDASKRLRLLNSSRLTVRQACMYFKKKKTPNNVLQIKSWTNISPPSSSSKKKKKKRWTTHIY